LRTGTGCVVETENDSWGLARAVIEIKFDSWGLAQAVIEIKINSWRLAQVVSLKSKSILGDWQRLCH